MTQSFTMCLMRCRLNDQVVAKASLRAKLILKRFQSRDPKLLTRAFCVFVRPILEYTSGIWNRRYKYQITKIEGVQRFFCKRLQGLWSHPYRSRLPNLVWIVYTAGELKMTKMLQDFALMG